MRERYDGDDACLDCHGFGHFCVDNNKDETCRRCKGSGRQAAAEPTGGRGIYQCMECNLRGPRDLWPDAHGLGMHCPKCHSYNVRAIEPTGGRDE